jgi:hypothetical protein
MYSVTFKANLFHRKTLQRTLAITPEDHRRVDTVRLQPRPDSRSEVLRLLNSNAASALGSMVTGSTPRTGVASAARESLGGRESGAMALAEAATAGAPASPEGTSSPPPSSARPRSDSNASSSSVGSLLSPGANPKHASRRKKPSKVPLTMEPRGSARLSIPQPPAVNAWQTGVNPLTGLPSALNRGTHDLHAPQHSAASVSFAPSQSATPRHAPQPTPGLPSTALAGSPARLKTSPFKQLPPKVGRGAPALPTHKDGPTAAQ